MKYYDLNFMILTSLDKGQLDSTVSWLDSKFNVQPESPDRKVQRRKLAYPIRKEVEAWHYQLKFVPGADISPKFFEELQMELKTKKEILRFLLLKKRDEPPAKESRRARKPEGAAAAESSENDEGSETVEVKESPVPEAVETETVAEVKKETAAETKKSKVQLQEIDQKLEEILKEE
ncbi:MAG: 30S ribosomal protein S6 [Candidatus Paceibacterota bacterium]|jgi:ribosomal protein S6